MRELFMLHRIHRGTKMSVPGFGCLSHNCWGILLKNKQKCQIHSDSARKARNTNSLIMCLHQNLKCKRCSDTSKLLRGQNCQLYCLWASIKKMATWYNFLYHSLISGLFNWPNQWIPLIPSPLEFELCGAEPRSVGVPWAENSDLCARHPRKMFSSWGT